MSRLSRLVLGLAATLWAAPAVAGGFGIPEIGVRRTAMGSIIGRPDDASAIYHNPAGLTLQHGWSLYLSLGLAMIDTEFALQAWDQSDRFLGTTANPDGYYDPVQPTRAMGVIPMIAVVGEVVPDKLTLGGALFVGNAQGAAFDKDAVTRYHLIEGYVIAPQAVIAASYRINDAIAVGGSAGIVNLRIKGEREVFPILNGMDLSNLTGTRPRLELEGSGWSPTWMVSAFGRPHPKVTWGASLVGRVDTEMTGPVTVTYSDDAAAPGDILTGTQKTTQLMPWSFFAGGAVDLSPNIELGLEGRYWLYRQFKKQTTDIEGIVLVKKLETIKNYRDSWEVSGGVRVHDLPAAPRLELMAGLQFDRSPAPPETVTLDAPSFTHPATHAGVRYGMSRFRLGASWVHYFYQVPTTTTSTTSPPSNFRGHGANNIITVSIEAQL